VDDVHLTPSQVHGVLPQQDYMKLTGNKVVLNLTGADNMKHVEPGDFVIHLRSFQGGIEHSSYRGKVSNAYTVFRPWREVEPRFFRWVLKSDGFIQELRTTTEQLRDGQSIKFEQFASVALPLPPLDEQRRIADFLDEQVQRIDRILAARRSQLLLTHEVRAGLLDARLDSCSDARVPLRRVLAPRQELNHPRLQILSIYRDLGVVPRESRTDNANLMPTELSRYQRVVVGDLVVNKMKAWSGSVAVSELEGIISPDYLVCAVDPRVSGRFLHHVLRSPRWVAEMRLRSKGIRPNQERLYWDDLAAIEIPVPALADQIGLADALDESLGDFEEVRRPFQESIQRLEELRAAVVCAAVTGAESDFARLGATR
jgi:type I restriction enzyme S subunit